MPPMFRGRTVATCLAVLTGSATLAFTAACDRQASDVPPHVQHVNLSPHKAWRVISVQAYQGLEEVELVRVDWPTAQDPRLAFALTREDLKPGDPVCLDHIVEIDTLWAHPVPEGGCAARDDKPARP